MTTRPPPPTQPSEPTAEGLARARADRNEALHLLYAENDRREAVARTAAAEGRDLDHEDDLTFESCGIVAVSDIEPETTDWLWEPFFPWGELAIVEGDPDVGKTTLMMKIIAAVTTGTPLPLGRPGALPSENVLYLTSEDSIAKTIRPRLEAAGADLRRVFVQTAGASELLLPGAIGAIEAITRRTRSRMLVLDPLNAYLDASKINVNREQDVRRGLQPAREVAERRRLVVIGLRHLSKNTDRPSLYRGGGSIGLAAVARSVVLVAKHPEDPRLRVVISQKSNLAADEKKRPQGFVIETDGRGRPRVEWEPEPVEIHADELLGPKKPGPSAAVLKQAKRYIKDHLAEGKKPRSFIVDGWVKTGGSIPTLDRAARDLKLVSAPNEQNAKERDWSLP